MAIDNQKPISGILLNTNSPTMVDLDDINAWVVWQFPRRKNGHHVGAVHPPEAKHGWYPALINTSKKQAAIYGHIEEEYDSPENAAKYFDAK